MIAIWSQWVEMTNNCKLPKCTAIFFIKIQIFPDHKLVPHVNLATKNNTSVQTTGIKMLSENNQNGPKEPILA